MKKVALPILCFLICLLFVACGSDNAILLPSVSQQRSSAIVAKDTITKEDVVQIFSDEESNKDCIVTDCVVAIDLAYGLTGIVQYTDKEGNPSCLAFVKDSWSHPVKLDAENTLAIADDSVLTYVGNGIVSLSLANRESGTVYDYTVEYSCEGANTNFKMSSIERK